MMSLSAVFDFRHIFKLFFIAFLDHRFGLLLDLMFIDSSNADKKDVYNLIVYPRHDVVIHSISILQNFPPYRSFSISISCIYKDQLLLKRNRAMTSLSITNLKVWLAAQQRLDRPEVWRMEWGRSCIRRWLHTHIQQSPGGEAGRCKKWAWVHWVTL